MLRIAPNMPVRAEPSRDRYCEYWVALADRQALGEPLAEDDLTFLRDHALSCAVCSQEQAMWRELQVPSARQDEPTEDEVDRVLLGVAQASRAQRRTRQQVWAGVAGGLAVAAAMALWFVDSRAPALEANERGAEAPELGASTSGAVVAGAQSAAAAAEQVAPTERGCAEVLAGIVLCTESQTVITRRDLSSNERVVELERGHLVVLLEPQPEGTSFSVATRDGKVTAVGTVFSVESSGDGATVTSVLEGKVRVSHSGEATAQMVAAGQRLKFGDAAPVALTESDAAPHLALLPQERRDELERALFESEAARAPRPRGAEQSEETLERARALRSSGEFKRAAELYRKIHEANPGTALGGTALLSLGELRLSSLGDAKGALAAFDTYLARGGALSQEALFGKIRALRALGRSAEERRSIERFLSQYPDTRQGQVLRARLDALSQ